LRRSVRLHTTIQSRILEIQDGHTWCSHRRYGKQNDERSVLYDYSGRQQSLPFIGLLLATKSL